MQEPVPGPLQRQVRDKDRFAYHADYQELIDYVQLVNPSLVYICNGEKNFVKHLRKAGFNAQVLERTRQLNLFE